MQYDLICVESVVKSKPTSEPTHGVTRVFSAWGQKQWSAPPRKSSRESDINSLAFGQIYHCGCAKPTITLHFCDFPLTVR